MCDIGWNMSCSGRGRIWGRSRSRSDVGRASHSGKIIPTANILLSVIKKSLFSNKAFLTIVTVIREEFAYWKLLHTYFLANMEIVP